MLSYVASTTVTETQWISDVGGIRGSSKTVKPSLVMIETRDTPPFAAHLEDYQKKYRCNCVVDTEEQVHQGGYGGAFGYGKTWRYWSLPKEEGIPFSFRSIEQTLIRQKVVNQFGHTTLDCNFRIDGCVSGDDKYYYFSLGLDGGNFAGCDVGYYVDFDTVTQRLTLHVRQQLYRGKYKRYQFDFELQDNPVPSPYSRGEGEIRSVLVPVAN